MFISTLQLYKVKNEKPKNQLAKYLLGILYNIPLLTICYSVSCDLLSHKHILE